jgi:peptidoglycan/xylan/chitin deacetylase (PgdA/CDA1 family)
MTIAQPQDFTAPLVALTFDDGPSEWTEPILDHFARHGGHGTFFVLGNEIERDDRQRTVLRLVEEGHEIGNHTYSHPGDLAALSDAGILDELSSTTALIDGIAGVTPVHWRTPFLRSTPRLLAVAGSLGLRHVDCSIMPGDWAVSGEETFGLVRDSLQPGAVIVLHDGRPWDELAHLSLPTREETVKAVELILDDMAERGMRCVTIAELATADPQNSSLGPPADALRRGR